MSHVLGPYSTTTDFGRYYTNPPTERATPWTGWWSVKTALFTRLVSWTSPLSTIKLSSQLPFEHPKRPKRSVTSRNLKKINLQNFQTDVCSFAAATESKCYLSSAVEDYNSGLGNILDQHAPLTARHVTDRPSAPWMTAELKEAKGRQRQAERRWRATRLTVHRAICVEERVKVHALHLTAKRQHFKPRSVTAIPANSSTLSPTSSWATL